MILVNEFMSQTIHEPSLDADTAFKISKKIIFKYLIIIFCNLNRPNSTPVLLHAGLHDLTLFSESEHPNFTFTTSGHNSLTVRGKGKCCNPMQMCIVNHVHDFAYKNTKYLTGGKTPLSFHHSILTKYFSHQN